MGGLLINLCEDLIQSDSLISNLNTSEPQSLKAVDVQAFYNLIIIVYLYFFNCFEEMKFKTYPDTVSYLRSDNRNTREDHCEADSRVLTDTLRDLGLARDRGSSVFMC